MFSKYLAALALIGAVGFGTSSAVAAPCTAYAGGAVPQFLNTTNVTLNTFGASDCYGHASVGANSLASVVTYANTTNPLFGAGWTGLYRIDPNGSAQGAVDVGLNFAITGLQFSTFDTAFTLVVTDNDLNAPPSLPVTIDLLFTLKAGTDTDFYFFDDFNLGSSNNGTYQMAIRNPVNSNFQNLSDISLLGRDIRNTDCRPGDPTCDPQRIPEPGSLALVGLALASVAGITRRRRQH